MNEITKPLENKYGVKVLGERPFSPIVWVQNCQFDELLSKIADANKMAQPSNRSDKKPTTVGSVYTLLRIGKLLDGNRFSAIDEEERDALKEVLDLLWNSNSGYEMIGDFCE